MNIKSVVSNFSVALIAQGMGLIFQVIMSLVVSKVLGVAEFGYWQLFLFYSSYVGFFHIGLNDGMYLIFGGQDRSIINKKSVNSQFVLGSGIQVIIAAVLFVVALVAPFDPRRAFVIQCFAIYMILANAASYLGYLFQAMNETKKFSISIIIGTGTVIVPVVFFLLTGVRSAEPYILAYLAAILIRLLYCLWYARDFLRAGSYGLSESAREVIASIRIGIKLLLANIASMLILGVARNAIDMVWGIETFGQVSFSVQMTNFFLTFVAQASMVLFPALRQSTEEELRNFFVTVRDFMGLAFPLIYLLYYPMVWILGLWLPQYKDSFAFFALLLPVCVYDSKMDISCTTFFKVNREVGKLLAVNVMATVISFIGVVIGAYVLHSVQATVIAAVLAIIIRNLVAEFAISRELAVGETHIPLTELIVTLIFIISSQVLSPILAIGVYAAAYGAFLLINKTSLQSTVSRLVSLRK